MNPELLGVFDSDGVYLRGTSMDDRSWQDYDSSAAFTAPRTGTYYVAVNRRTKPSGTAQRYVRSANQGHHR